MGNVSSNQNLSEADIRKLFSQLDKDNSGELELDELMTFAEQQLPGLTTDSPTLLFRFDDGQDGTMNFEEFQRLIRYLESKQRDKERKEKAALEKQAEMLKPRRKKKSLANVLRKREKKSGSDAHCWTTLDLATATELNLNRDEPTPAILGHSMDNRRTSVDEESQQEKKQEEEPSFDFLNKLFKRSEGRKRYMAWLFKLADTEHTEQITVSELSVVLKALRKDGIDISKLSYEKKKLAVDQPVDRLAGQLMKEYDTGGTGFLNKKEFKKLANLIIKLYQEKAEKKRKIGKYLLKWKLGEGSSGAVRIAVNTETNEQKAIKIIRRGDVSDMSRLDTEIRAMMMLKHPNIVVLEEVLEDDDNVYFVMELCGGGSLADFLSVKPLSEMLARYYVDQLVEGVAYCHSQGVCHRDLKLLNLLLDDNGILHISDFGHAGIFTQDWDLFSTQVGSLMHLAPEQIEGQCYSGEKVDIWAMGVVIYRLLVGNAPFFDSSMTNVNNVSETLAAIKAGNFVLPSTVPAEAADLITKMLQVDPRKRIGIPEIKEHSWLQGMRKQPRLDRFEMPLDTTMPISSWRQWKIFAKKAIKKCKMVYVSVHAAQRKPYCLAMIKVHYPAKELKFSVSLVDTRQRHAEHRRRKKAKERERALKQETKSRSASVSGGSPSSERNSKGSSSDKKQGSDRSRSDTKTSHKTPRKTSDPEKKKGSDSRKASSREETRKEQLKRTKSVDIPLRSSGKIPMGSPTRDVLLSSSPSEEEWKTWEDVDHHGAPRHLILLFVCNAGQSSEFQEMVEVVTKKFTAALRDKALKLSQQRTSVCAVSKSTKSTAKNLGRSNTPLGSESTLSHSVPGYLGTSPHKDFHHFSSASADSGIAPPGWNSERSSLENTRESSSSRSESSSKSHTKRGNPSPRRTSHDKGHSSPRKHTNSGKKRSLDIARSTDGDGVGNKSPRGKSDHGSSHDKDSDHHSKKEPEETKRRSSHKQHDGSKHDKHHRSKHEKLVRQSFKLKIEKLKTETGDKIGKYTSTHYHDHYGDEDNRKEYVKLCAGDEKYLGYCTFFLPQSVAADQVLEMSFKFNYCGSKGWKWSIKDCKKNFYLPVGLTTTKAHEWKMLSTSLTHPSRYIHENQVKVRLKGAYGKVKLDFVQLGVKAMVKPKS